MMISPRLLLLTLALLGLAGAAPRVELSGVGDALAVDVADDAPAVVEVVGDGIVPIRWDRAGRSRGTLPLFVLPGAASTLALDVAGERAEVDPRAAAGRVRIDANLYAREIAAPGPDLRRTLGAAATATLALLLAARLRRRAPAALVALAAAGAVGVAIAARRPDVAHVETAGHTWLVARRAATARVPAPAAIVVESAAHLRSLAPRIRLDAAGPATLELALPRGARVAIVDESVDTP